MRNTNPRDGEIGRSWGKWVHHYAERKKHKARTQQAGFVRWDVLQVKPHDLPSY